MTTQPPPYRAPAMHPGGVAAAPASVAPPWPAAGRGPGGAADRPYGANHGVGTVVALVVLGVLGIAAVAVVGFSVGLAALPGAAVLALVPLALVLAAVRWVDRWEPEPWQSLAVAFGWGASVAVLVALLLNTGAVLALVAAGTASTSADLVAATVVAPVVEESIKAAGVLVVFLAWRRSFDGPVDGLVYAATVAAGFAFVENILYFGGAMSQAATTAGGGQAVAMVFVMRAVMSPFAHLLFTACTGLALGLAADSRSRHAWVWALPVGLAAAVLLHGLWNGSASMGSTSEFLVLYAVVQVPLFLAAVGLVVWLRSREARVVRTRLAEYAAAWWFAPAEIAMLTSLRERRRARTWAAGRGGPGARGAMAEFQALATRLAYLRQRIATGRAPDHAAHEEAALLAALVATRHRLQTALPV
ncbi:PrsW family intramembrane metalloprotease [Actinotalea subterranea]|uniref:PrsW family intramembrane metalloprotease n=1 Tax=Actinotalea subterranea TaxID=2607497 RepID=UPI0011EC8F95|nr:PrsW family intramembrane metalloprotease [Actinotalea subterranea]